MSHVVTYTTSGGDVWDLSGAPGSKGLLGFAQAATEAEWQADSSTGALTRQPAEWQASLHLARGDADALLEAMAADCDEGGGTLSVDGWARSTAARVISYDRLPDGTALASLTLRSQEPAWRRATRVSLRANAADESETTGLDLPTDHPFDLAGAARASGMDGVVMASPFLVRLTFFGPCSSPYATVTSTSGGAATSNRYGVAASCDAGERIVIDPTATRQVGRSVCKVGAWGERTNLFDARVRGAEGSGTYAFQRLPAGRVTVAWPQAVALDVELIEERVVLPWGSR